MMFGARTLRACLKTRSRAVVEEKVLWRGAKKENILYGSSTNEQRRQRAFSSTTRRAADLLPLDFVGLLLTARCGDARSKSPRSKPNSLAAALFLVFRQALNDYPPLTRRTLTGKAASPNPLPHDSQAFQED
jgi:hypothetical protein